MASHHSEPLDPAADADADADVPAGAATRLCLPLSLSIFPLVPRAPRKRCSARGVDGWGPVVAILLPQDSAAVEVASDLRPRTARARDCFLACLCGRVEVRCT